MSERLYVWMPCVPPRTTHQHKRVVHIAGHARLGDREELVSAKATLDALLLPHRPSRPFEGAVTLELRFVWPWRASEPKRVRALGRLPHTSRPDCSNLAKTIEDRLVALRFVGDDNAVSRLVVEKFWGDAPGIGVTIEKAEVS